MKRYGLLICLSGILCTLLIMTYEKSQVQFNTVEALCLLQYQEYAGMYEYISENKIKCDLMTLSAIVYQMKADGYKEINCKNSESEIDIILKKDDIELRLHYNSNQELTSICKDYKRSYIPLTYIIEREV